MDTRTKIIDRAAVEHLARAGARLTVVTGYFDPLTAAHAARLEAIAAGGGTLVAVVRAPGQPLLAARARAELIAALAAVGYVIVEEGDPVWLGGLAGAELVHEEEADSLRRRDLIALVHRRQAAG